MTVDTRRTRILNEHQPGLSGPVVYWMSRDQRVCDNWALLYAAELATQRGVPLAVVFALTPLYQGATLRHYDFMLRGLETVVHDLKELNIPLYVLSGEVTNAVTGFVDECTAGTVVTDFSPVKIGREWREKVAQSVKIPVVEVDAHNVVPVWVASAKEEVGARTLRPKLHRLLPEFLTEFPDLESPTHPWPTQAPSFSAADTLLKLKPDPNVPPVTWISPGELAAKQALDDFLKNRLGTYAERRNDPNSHSQSELSPYLHFGQLSAQRVALEVTRSHFSQLQTESFLEELIVRRELSDNFCFYNRDYDSTLGFPSWASRSLELHQSDDRQYLYSLAELEQAQTHDELWNASQLEMVKRGKMHSYLRMYWAKKILEWSSDSATALKWATFLNDKYQLDGRDPNGYTGIAWSLGGVHDRPWFERPIFGQVRYMNFAGASRKFSIANYVKYVSTL